MSGLSHLVGIKTSSEFTIGIIRGLGCNLSEKSKETFAKEVCHFVYNYTISSEKENYISHIYNEI